jgi:hypothetical protein
MIIGMASRRGPRPCKIVVFISFENRNRDLDIKFGGPEQPEAQR